MNSGRRWSETSTEFPEEFSLTDISESRARLLIMERVSRIDWQRSCEIQEKMESARQWNVPKAQLPVPKPKGDCSTALKLQDLSKPN
jgi:hypothetical protein